MRDDRALFSADGPLAALTPEARAAAAEFHFGPLPIATADVLRHQQLRDARAALEALLVPFEASETEVPSTGRISITPEVSPPSNRISASATTPIVRASS